MADPLPSHTLDAPAAASDAAAPSEPAAEARAAPLPWALLAPIALAPILIAVLQLGRWHPDEVYQYLEPAWHRVHHYGILAWEWTDGIRNWAVPLLFAGILEIAKALGIEHPQARRALIAIPQLLLGLAMMASVYRYAERRVGGVHPAAPAVAALLVGAYWPVLYLSGRTMGESLSAALLVIACERLERPERPAWNGSIGGLLLGLSVVARYGSAVFVLAILAWLALSGRWKALGAAIASGLVVAAALGALDWATWGRPFHSLLAYVHYNVTSGEAARAFGAHPWWYYLQRGAAWLAVWAYLGIVAAIRRERDVPLTVFAAGAYLLAISATAHKEERFMYPAMVLLAVAAAPAFVALVSSLRRGWVRAAAVALSFAAGIHMAYWGPDTRGDQFRALVKATRDPEATGLLIVNEGLWGSGGYFYVGRNIPWYNADSPPQVLSLMSRDRRLNRVITFQGRALAELQRAGWQVTGQIGRETILARPR